ncbi:MAG: hypothetical protein COA56_15840 [Dehalococcoidia bacterium]|jgi:hypothetical protein|nr:hypothetical protein [Dehalococcoidia bacterium]PKB81337.1 MAG: hypothetical protein BZY84_06740 [SAR202 cluster bacterium MP-SInd-SRR3963457-G1]PKB84710.1 MAG: hypothetical protein BZY86_06195 [SAR202 cluster bacterium MP-NPac-SRR3961935-G1]RUA28462.1 MAG: hypothetical protein DSY78_15620 [Chloroflexota bacterium]PCJ72519.1 MAG: hypothetical protein COA56_15840 [Dehalococcoidia bacterium]|tara:strand:+ start:1025 stop:1282 length:258 start_codon:yes stop_codon:yes gene_type:complete
MRFHATLTHAPESCPGPRGGPPVTDWPARAAEVGIELISAVQCQMSHSQFFVVETDEYAKLHEFFVPFQGISTAEFTPVRDLMAL